MYCVPRTPYYDRVGDVVGKMYNFNNVGDAALSAWELQQITKPDGGGWGYNPNTTSPTFPYGSITDHFFSPNGEIFWETNPKEILARIIPSRSLSDFPPAPMLI